MRLIKQNFEFSRGGEFGKFTNLHACIRTSARSGRRICDRELIVHRAVVRQAVCLAVRCALYYRTAALNYWQHMVSPSTVAWHHRFPQFVAKCPRTHTTPCSLLAASIQSTSARAPRRAPHEIIFPLQASNCRQFKRHACPFCWLVGADINHPWTLKLLSILFHVACHSDVPQTPQCPDLNIDARCE